jgi:hypothetical protein
MKRVRYLDGVREQVSNAARYGPNSSVVRRISGLQSIERPNFTVRRALFPGTSDCQL